MATGFIQGLATRGPSPTGLWMESFSVKSQPFDIHQLTVLNRVHAEV